MARRLIFERVVRCKTCGPVLTKPGPKLPGRDLMACPECHALGIMQYGAPVGLDDVVIVKG